MCTKNRKPEADSAARSEMRADFLRDYLPQAPPCTEVFVREKEREVVIITGDGGEEKMPVDPDVVDQRVCDYLAGG